MPCVHLADLCSPPPPCPGGSRTTTAPSIPLQDARIARDNESIKRAISDYDEALEAYIPGLMAMASIYWDMSHYSAVERIFRQSAEFCSEHDVWKLNVAHTYFMQDNHYKEAIR